MLQLVAATETFSSPVQSAARTVEHHHVLVVGGGTGGVSVAARLRRALPPGAVAILEPSEQHFYQPLWTLVGGGVFPKERSLRPQASVIPRGVRWLLDAAERLEPDDCAVVTRDGRRLTYDFLVVAPGIQIDWDAVAGLPAALMRAEVTSIWSYEGAERTWNAIRAFAGGTAIFTCPSTPIKCPGAAQKIAYLADDTFRRNGVRRGSRVIFATAGPGIFAVEKYARTLRQVIERRGIELLTRHELVEVRPDAREAVFQQLDTGDSVSVPYDLLHVAPPQSAPDFVKASPLAGANGWIEVDKQTLQHPRWPNVFALGDAAALAISKTGAAVRWQARILAENLLAARDARSLPGAYDGYTACPLVTGYGKLVLAEFDYDGKPKETFPFDQSKERRSMWLLKKYGLPALYWRGILRGRA